MRSGILLSQCYINAAYSDSNMSFPRPIISIIAGYFRSVFEWDPQNCASTFKLSDNNITIELEKIYLNSMAISKNVISFEDSHIDYVEWVMQLNYFDADHETSILMAIGFVECPTSESVRSLERDDFLCGTKQYGIYLCIDREAIWDVGKKLVLAHHNGNCTKIDKDVMNIYNIKVNDKFKFIFDLKKKRCDFWYNGKQICTLADDLHKDIKPAIACWGSHKLSCTEWQCRTKSDI